MRPKSGREPTPERNSGDSQRDILFWRDRCLQPSMDNMLHRQGRLRTTPVARGHEQNQGTVALNVVGRNESAYQISTYHEKRVDPGNHHVAVRLHRLIDSLSRGGASGERQKSDAWPTA